MNLAQSQLLQEIVGPNEGRHLNVGPSDLSSMMGITPRCAGQSQLSRPGGDSPIIRWQKTAGVEDFHTIQLASNARQGSHSHRLTPYLIHGMRYAHHTVLVADTGDSLLW
jgi:hypothetical protein